MVRLLNDPTVKAKLDKSARELITFGQTTYRHDPTNPKEISSSQNNTSVI